MQHSPDHDTRPFAVWVDATHVALAQRCTCGDDRCQWVADAVLSHYRPSEVPHAQPAIEGG